MKLILLWLVVLAGSIAGPENGLLFGAAIVAVYWFFTITA